MKKQIRELLDIQDPQFYDRLGRFAVRRIRKVVRAGVSPVTNRRFPRLKKSTKSRRERLAQHNKTSKFYRRGKSNLHFTGQLLRGLEFDVRGKKVFVASRGKRKPLKNEDGTRAKRNPSNEQVARYVAKQGRPFLGMEEKGKQKIREMVAREVRKKIRKQGLSKRRNK